MVIRAATRGLVGRAWLSAYPWCFRTTVCTVFICVLLARLCWEALLITLVKIYLDTHA